MCFVLIPLEHFAVCWELTHNSAQDTQEQLAWRSIKYEYKKAIRFSLKLKMAGYTRLSSRKLQVDN